MSTSSPYQNNSNHRRSVSVQTECSGASYVRPLHEVRIFLENRRPKIESVPSPRCQTLVFQSAMQHLWGLEHFASFVLVSETLRNSSFGANLLMSFLSIDRQTIRLFNTILTPQKCLSLQFIHSLHVDAFVCDDMTHFATQMLSTKYLRRQLHALSLNFVDESVVSCFFGGGDNTGACAVTQKTCWPQLRSLSFTMSRVSDDALEKIAASLNSRIALSINLHDCVMITDRGLRNLGAFSVLTLLDIGGCNISDVGVQFVATKLKALTSLDISYCDKVTNNAVQCIAENLTALRFLKLEQCSITNVGLQLLAKGELTSLTWLDLSYIEKISDVGLQHISSLSTLCCLNLEGCTNIKDSAKVKFNDALPNCRLMCHVLR